jgi:hypothetical protein
LSERHADDLLDENDFVEVENKPALSYREITLNNSNNIPKNLDTYADEEKSDSLNGTNEKNPYDNNLNMKENDFDEYKSDKKIFDDNHNDSSNDDDDDSKAIVCPPVTESYLPSWVLKMRNKINESRLEHAKAESRIDSLHLSISNLDLNLQTLRNLKTTANTLAEVEKITNIATYSFFLHHLPTDLIGKLFD